jgi:hypothetical protein
VDGWCVEESEPESRPGSTSSATFKSRSSNAALKDLVACESGLKAKLRERDISTENGISACFPGGIPRGIKSEILLGFLLFSRLALVPKNLGKLRRKLIVTVECTFVNRTASPGKVCAFPIEDFFRNPRFFLPVLVAQASLVIVGA